MKWLWRAKKVAWRNKSGDIRDMYPVERLLRKRDTQRNNWPLIFHLTGAGVIIAIACFSSSAGAQPVPGAADTSRIEPLQNTPGIPDNMPASSSVSSPMPETEIPASAVTARMVLHEVEVEGVSAFSQEEIAQIYAPYLGKEVTLEKVWRFAGEITDLYRKKGYFLSRAYVPAQEIENGTVTIRVVEGYIADVGLDDPIGQRDVIRKILRRLKSFKPVSALQLESAMLQLNDLPGVSFRAFVEPLDNGEQGGVRLSLVPSEDAPRASISFDNFGSRYLGPYQGTASVQDSILPLQETQLMGLSSLPSDELRYVAMQHRIPLYPGWAMEFSGSYVTAAPGASLAPNDIRSDSVDLALGVVWQPIRQREENLLAAVEINGKNTNGDIFRDNPLTRDRMRVARLRLNYDTDDAWDGYNYLSAGINHGLEIIGASEKGDLNLSRAEAAPDFTTLTMNYTRQQALPGEWLSVGQVAGQIASDPLFSAEEFGYGGQSFGRAYDPSEITGDHGLAGMFELRYLGVDPWLDSAFVPYTFYDIGKVWNKDSGGSDFSASSAGLGVRVSHQLGIYGNLGLAWPLSRAIEEPIYGNGKNPRLMLQIGWEF